MSAAAALLLACLGVLGCGAAPAALSPGDATQLRAGLADARGDAGQAAAALGSLSRRVVALRSDGELARDRAATMLAEIGQAQARVPLDVGAAPVASPAPAAAPAPGPAPAAPPGTADVLPPGDAGAGQPQRQGDGQNHGKGHGHGDHHSDNQGNGGGSGD